MKSATGKATYGYDGLGHRVSVVGTDGVNRIQVYSQDGQLLYSAPSGGTVTKYIYLHNHVLAEKNGSTVTYNHTDGLGSPVAQSNAAGQVVNPTRYEPYGYITAGTPRTLGFTGHVSDSDTGLTYMQQRYYDPIAGRMLSIDPVTTDANTGGSFNRYVYANNNPYRYIDPDGREARGIENHYCETYSCEGGSTVTSSRGISTPAQVGAVLGGLAGGLAAAGCDAYSVGTCVVANPAIVAGGVAGGAALGAAAVAMAHNGTGQLRKAMADAGNYLHPKYWSHHHIVAQDSLNPSAVQSRAILDSVGMGLNDAFNGIVIHSMYHDRIHTSIYYDAVNSNLRGAKTYGDVALRLTAIRVEINLGVFPW